ncbi:TVP38/TMEM64 family protein [Rubinisphaera margarita]|uniref:TVP38/TMEM64 family protein n=1 Tax=Rubinisphaera margarita TaxID=2909586 RepID=UPI001EE7C160|nr:VTT domain-containing protein [Rubinisphaera margarita]MCG6154689.1 VTT domain-containing protein [Rubinisphaera margarita]
MNSESEDQAGLSTRRSLKRLILVFVLILLVPIIPFLVLGDVFEASQLEWLKASVTPERTANLLLLLLAVDIFLPVPSSGVITYGGSQLGFLTATLFATVGLILGAAIGYEIARTIGRPALRRWAKPDDEQLLHRFVRDWGTFTLVVSRPLPILGEAAVLMLGAGRLRRALFYPVLALTNLAIAAAYAALGSWFSDDRYLPVVLILSLFVPLGFTLLLKKWLPRTES